MSDQTSRVTLVFSTDEEKQEFMNQLSDGWGENYVSLRWIGQRGSDPGGSFDRATLFMVHILEEDTFEEELPPPSMDLTHIVIGDVDG